MGNRDDMMMRRGSCSATGRRRGWGQSAQQGCRQASDYGRERERTGSCGCGGSNNATNNSTEGLGGVCRLFGTSCGARQQSEPPQSGCARTPAAEGSCGCGCGQGSGSALIQPRRQERARGGCRGCGAMMRQLQELDFSIQETVLYLDAYPDCRQALDYYHQLVAQRQELAAQYEAACGPLTAMGNLDEDAWRWKDTPWPWQPDFPGNGHN